MDSTTEQLLASEPTKPTNSLAAVPDKRRSLALKMIERVTHTYVSSLWNDAAKSNNEAMVNADVEVCKVVCSELGNSRAADDLFAYIDRASATAGLRRTS